MRKNVVRRCGSVVSMRPWQQIGTSNRMVAVSYLDDRFLGEERVERLRQGDV